MSHHFLASLDIEDMTKSQLRKLLNGVARSQLPYHKKTKEEQEEAAEQTDSEAEAVAELHAEKKGKDPLASLEDEKTAKLAKKKKKSDEDEDDDEDEGEDA